jgi:hypothetical protein
LSRQLSSSGTIAEGTRSERPAVRDPAIADLDASGMLRLAVPAAGEVGGGVLLERRLVWHFDLHRDQVVRHIVRFDVEQVLEAGERERGGGVDDGDPLAVPAAAGLAGSLAVHLLERSPREPPDAHRSFSARSAVDAVFYPRQHALDHARSVSR